MFGIVAVCGTLGYIVLVAVSRSPSAVISAVKTAPNSDGGRPILREGGREGG